MPVPLPGALHHIQRTLLVLLPGGGGRLDDRRWRRDAYVQVIEVDYIKQKLEEARGAANMCVCVWFIVLSGLRKAAAKQRRDVLGRKKTKIILIILRACSVFVNGSNRGSLYGQSGMPLSFLLGTK